MSEADGEFEGGVLDDEAPPAASEHAAKIISPGDAKGRPTIELRLNDDGTNEAFLVPLGAAPVATGVSLVAHKGKWGLNCRRSGGRVRSGLRNTRSSLRSRCGPGRRSWGVRNI